MIGEQIRILRQLQHLALIREEESSFGGREGATPLSVKMAELTAGLSPEIADLYGKLSARSPLFVSPLARGNCSSCGIRIPMAQLQHVIAGDRLVLCSGCGRVLYAPEVKATGIRTDEPDPKYLLSRFSSSKLMIPQLAASSSQAAMEELAARLAREKIVAEPQTVVRAALERERILTTAVGHGLAFPHMRGVEEGVLTFACGLSPAGIVWGNERVHLVFFTVLPVVASPFYLKLLSAFANTFENGEKLPFLLAATDAKTLWKELNKATRVAIKHL